MKRAAALDSIRHIPEVSVLIMGGGVNGIGLLRHLALQGIDVLLVERSDFCAGASAASTRVIHGGLRYLENSEFRLVRESLRERNRLLNNAPHYVKPLPTTIPISDWTSGLVHGALQFFRLRHKPNRRGALLIKIGLSLYDVFAGMGRYLPRHRFTGRAQALAERPQLDPNIVCTATYYDARITYPERLCLELVLDAEAASSQVKALNYVGVVGAEGGTVTLRDELSGETLPVKPKIVVNATGAWIDFTNGAMHRSTEYIGGTKGSHLVIDHAELWQATRGEMLYYTNSDGRICIFYPVYDKVIAGSTDLPTANPDAVCEEDEVEYMLAALRQVFPTIKVDHSHVVYRFCGVRPLPRMDAATPGQISRDHHCAVLPPGDGLTFPIYSLIGGKWTTFRAFAEQVTDQLLPVLGRTRIVNDEQMPVGGGKNYPRTTKAKRDWLTRWQGRSGLSTERLETLLDRYGTYAEKLIGYITAQQDAPLATLSDYSVREIQFIASEEFVVHLDDLLLRRTLIGLLGRASEDVLNELATIIAPVLGWSAEDVQKELDRTWGILEMRHGIRRVRETALF